MSVLSSNTPIYPVSFVSLGPGDPELITLKGLRLLREADIIYCPASVISEKGRRETAGSEIPVNTETEKKEKSGNTSRAAKILEALEIDSRRVCLFPLPMSKDRDAALRTYDRVYEQAAQACRESKKAVIVAEGDAGFYSSVQYIYDRFIENGIPVERTAGVPAFIAAGALAGIHIVKQEEPLSVLPGIVDCNVLLQSLEQGTHAVIMKLSQSEAQIKECMRLAPWHHWHYFENIGTEREFYTDSIESILQRRFPYFSLIIVTPHTKTDNIEAFAFHSETKSSNIAK